MVMVADELLVSIILVAEGPLIKVRLVMPSVMAISSQVPALEKPKAYWDSTDALLVTEPPEIMMLLVWTHRRRQQPATDRPERPQADA